MSNVPAWSWLIIGILLMLMEVLTPGFVIFFFGLAAATVSIFVWLLPEFSIYWQLVAFSVLSVIYVLVLRRYVQSVFMGDGGDVTEMRDDMVGRIGRVTELVRPEAPGRVLVGDAEWSASSSMRIEKGMEVKVLSRSNLTVEVAPVE